MISDNWARRGKNDTDVGEKFREIKGECCHSNECNKPDEVKWNNATVSEDEKNGTWCRTGVFGEISVALNCQICFDLLCLGYLKNAKLNLSRYKLAPMIRWLRSLPGSPSKTQA